MTCKRRSTFLAALLAGFLFFTVTAGGGNLTAQESEGDALRVLPPRSDRPRNQGMLRDYYRRQSHAAFDRRRERLESLTTPVQIAAYQRRLREQFVDSLGGFPERTPLNARTVGKLRGDGFHVERVVYESQPGFFVAANLYLPDAPPPHPGVLLPCGHTANGKVGYQRPAILLAKSGLAVLCFDPIGQGERKQILKEDAARAEAAGLYAATSEHTICGVAPILLGRSVATTMIWDSIRSLDYLASREEVDPERLGCTGNSGGGMMTSYLMALDKRIVAAAPGCFITTSRQKNESPGPGDAEQNIFAQYSYGLDHPDLLILHAPQPALICSATRDFVPIAGTWDAFRQAKRIYTRLGDSERVDLIETDANHGFSVRLREGVARFMRRWLLDKDDVVVEDDFPVFSAAELQCTPQGQALLLDGARSIFDLNRREAERLAAERAKRWKSLSPAARRAAVREVVQLPPLDELPSPEVERVGRVSRAGYSIVKVILTPEEGIQLPALHFVPDIRSGRRCLYVHGRGKQVDAAPGGPIEALVRDGAEVLAVDLRGFGETAMSPWRTGPAAVTGDNGAEYFVAYMLGESFVGPRARDLLVSARWLREFHDENGKAGKTSTGEESSKAIDVIAVEDAAIPALHAAAVEPELFGEVKLVRSIDSWRRVIDTAVTRRQLEGAVHGVLRVYDLPELRELAGGKNVKLVEPIDADGRPLKQD